MATKAELVQYGQANGVAVDDSMLKTDIEQALRDAGHDPETLAPTQQESTPSDPEPQATPPADQGAQSMSDQSVSGHTLGGAFVPVEEAYEKGWSGARPEVHDDEEYALTSGPHSPGANPDPDNPGGYLTPEIETEEVP